MKVFLIGMKDETPSEWQTKGNTDMKQLDAVAAILVIVGALNWARASLERHLPAPVCNSTLERLADRFLGCGAPATRTARA